MATTRALYHLGPEVARDLALLGWAGELAESPRLPRGRNERWTALLQQIDEWQPPAFPLRGRDALALGVSPGPRLGILLKDVERWWEEGDFRAGRDDCLRRLAELVDGA
jgi:hypothetical protein